MKSDTIQLIKYLIHLNGLKMNTQIPLWSMIFHKNSTKTIINLKFKKKNNKIMVKVVNIFEFIAARKLLVKYIRINRTFAEV